MVSSSGMTMGATIALSGALGQHVVDQLPEVFVVMPALPAAARAFVYE